MTCEAGLSRMKVISGLLSWMFGILEVTWILLTGVGRFLGLHGVRLVIARLVLIFVLPLDIYGRLRVMRSMFIPGALPVIEASFVADSSRRKLRTAMFKVVWSDCQPLTNPGAVLSLLDGPSGCDPAFCVVWFRFRMLRMYLAYMPEEVLRVHRLHDSAAEGCPGHGPAHLLVGSAAG